MSIDPSHSPIFFQQSPISVIGEDNVAAEEIIHHRWHVNDFMVCLIEERGFLKYKTTDKSQQEIYTDNIEIPVSKTLEKMVSSLKKCKVMVDEDGIARFFIAYQTWNDSSRKVPQHLEEAAASSSYDPTVEISLIRGPEDLVWNVFQRFSKESSFHSFQKATIPSSRCHPETVALIEQIKRKAFKDPNFLACLISDFTARVVDWKDLCKKRDEIYLEKEAVQQKQGYQFGAVSTVGTLGVTALSYSMTTTLVGLFAGMTISTGAALPLAFAWGLYSSRSQNEFFKKKTKPINDKINKCLENGRFLIEIEPISLPSEIDPRMRVSKFTWAVTIVNGLEGPSKNHTAIIVEGLANEHFQGSVPDGEYFIHKSEFNPPISSHLYSLRKLKMYIPQGMRRTEAWMRSSKQVIVMLQEIARQQRLHEEQTERGEEMKWAVTGSDSWFSGGLDNCFTWTRKSVAMVDIKLGKNFHSGMFAWPRAFTDTFKE